MGKTYRHQSYDKSERQEAINSARRRGKLIEYNVERYPSVIIIKDKTKWQ